MQVAHVHTLAQDLDNVRRMREALGPDIDIMIDVNMGWSADVAIEMGRKFEPYNIYWLGEAVSLRSGKRAPAWGSRCPPTISPAISVLQQASICASSAARPISRATICARSFSIPVRRSCRARRGAA